MRKHYLIAYDVACSKRLRKVHKYLSDRGFALQYSVFVVHDYSSNCQTILSELSDFIDHDDDALVCMTLHTQSPVVKFGKSTPDGIFVAHEDPYMNALFA